MPSSSDYYSSCSSGTNNSTSLLEIQSQISEEDPVSSRGLGCLGCDKKAHSKRRQTNVESRVFQDGQDPHRYYRRTSVGDVVKDDAGKRYKVLECAMRKPRRATTPVPVAADPALTQFFKPRIDFSGVGAPIEIAANQVELCVNTSNNLVYQKRRLVGPGTSRL
eukprot:Blabericola_migrator_1__1164@NODE_12_length_24658_cov_176_683258_g9_i0_p17_GENE_NODE_12_length_24658_cov_176_683258_g9_i0NODE_12_length_24658_cov_176_683258_g9_i0_p17_ORF_typecomplete_len164_score35_72_NODE_12_length_24658_cov_176_683258_g9_i02182622317